MQFDGHCSKTLHTAFMYMIETNMWAQARHNKSTSLKPNMWTDRHQQRLLHCKQTCHHAPCRIVGRVVWPIHSAHDL